MKRSNKRKLTVKQENYPLTKKQKFEETSNQRLQKLFSRREELRQHKVEIKEINFDNISAFQKKEKVQELARIDRELEIIRLEITTISPKIKEGIPDTEDSGMVHQHSLTFSKFASANDMVVIWRPINKNAASRLGRSINPYMGKSLNIKTKSSEFGPIAGDIPCAAGLSKLAITEPNRVSELDEKNKVALDLDNEKYQQVKNNIKKDNLAEINDLLLLKSVQKKTSDGKLIYYFADNQDQVVWNEQKTSPLFAIQTGEKNKWLFYREETQDFDLRASSTQIQPTPIQIMAYRQFFL
jgi:hypothetical protein